MNIFSEIEGSSGERLSSALLRYLIFNSPEIRDDIIRLFSKKSPVGPLEYFSHFSCETEFPTTDDDHGNGWLDILIQLDDVVIGIENKFNAPFQEGQPKKYINTLEQIRSSLSEIRRSEVRRLLFLLCPASRIAEATSKIQNIANAAVVTWEEVLDTLKSVKAVSNPVSSVVYREFVKYLERQLVFIDSFKTKLPHFNRSFPDYGTVLQAELVKAVWPYFPRAGPRLSKGTIWVGYYFYVDAKIEEKGWYGFLPASQIQDTTGNCAEFVIASTYDPKLSEEFIPVRLTSDVFIGEPDRTKAWIIRFDDEWDKADVWRKKLEPFWSIVKPEVT